MQLARLDVGVGEIDGQIGINDKAFVVIAEGQVLEFQVIHIQGVFLAGGAELQEGVGGAIENQMADDFVVKKAGNVRAEVLSGPDMGHRFAKLAGDGFDLRCVKIAAGGLDRHGETAGDLP